MDYRINLLSPAAAYGRVLDFIRSTPKQGGARNEAGETEAEHALRWATTLAESLAKKHYPEATRFKALPDLVGVISQIDNMTTGLVRAAPSVEPAPADPHAPKEVFLQLYGDSSADEGPVNYEAGDVSWCWHQVFESDVRYVQAASALHQEPVAWEFIHKGPGTQMVLASIDSHGSEGWPLDEWTSVVRYALVRSGEPEVVWPRAPKEPKP